MFIAIGIGFYLLLNGNPFASALDSQPTSVIAQLNPDITQIPVTHEPITPNNAPNSPTFAAILADLNSARQNAGLDPLELNSALNDAAAAQALFTASIYDPIHSDANGQFVDARVQAQGYAWTRVGENLLSNWSIDGHEVFTLWQNSVTHNTNMMNPAFTELGLAYMVTPIGQVYHAMVLANAA